MKKYLIIPATLILLALSTFTYSGDFKISLKGGVVVTLPAAEILSVRELTAEYSPSFNKIPFRHSIRLIQDSYDDFVWGDSTRWGAKWIITFIEGPFSFRAGPGISLSSTYTLKRQMSFDLYLELRYSIFVIEIDNLFFEDGFFNKNSLGLDLNLWQQNLRLFFGIGGYINTDYDSSLYYPTLQGGLSYEF
jgi:hypothetical protein